MKLSLCVKFHTVKVDMGSAELRNAHLTWVVDGDEQTGSRFCRLTRKKTTSEHFEGPRSGVTWYGKKSPKICRIWNPCH
jgi:hypothetical protein